MEEADTNKTKVSDSANSTSCNSRSQRSRDSSKSLNSGSSHSSGYGSHPATVGSVTEFTQPALKRNKDKKKKGARTSSALPAPTVERLTEDEEASGSGEAADVQPEEAESDNIVNTSGLELGPELVFGGIASPHDNEALQIAAISQTLSFIQKLKKSSTEEPAITAEAVEESEETSVSKSTPLPPTPEKTSRTKEEFTAIISMSDGFVKHTSSGITDVLGFPKDMWAGRSIIDFVQPKDRAAFASYITSGVTSPLTQVDTDCGRRSQFFCSLRCYRGLKRCGFGVKDKAVQFRPCQLMLTFREHLNGFPLPEEPIFEHTDAASTTNTAIPGVGREQPHIYLEVTVSPVSSAYTYPEETQVLPKFATRLLASTHLNEVDPECVPYLGFLPQDMLGHSVLEFYHPQDMPFMKDVYENVIKEQGTPFLSKPYRFRTQNGDYVLLETEWSSFSNPWSRKLEFILAQHRVLKGPHNPDVFAAPPEGDASAQMSEEVLKESKVIQEEIQKMLNEAMTNAADNSKKRKRYEVLASFMDMEENKKPDLHVEVPPKEGSFSERDSVMLGETSPPHEYYDSKSSSETPPSYNQLNYNDIIQRWVDC